MVSIFVGTAVTVMVKSISVPASLLVPLGRAGLLRPDRAFSVATGANIGTTATGFLAALAACGPTNAMAGLQIALVHLLFNMSATLVVCSITAIRNLSLSLSRSRASLVVRSHRLTVSGLS